MSALTEATDLDVLIDNLVSVIPDEVTFRVKNQGNEVVWIEVIHGGLVRIRIEVEDLSLVSVFEFVGNGVLVASSKFSGREDRVTLGAQAAIEAALAELAF